MKLGNVRKLGNSNGLSAREAEPPGRHSQAEPGNENNKLYRWSIVDSELGIEKTGGKASWKAFPGRAWKRVVLRRR
jgi:hypothetical protein